MPPESLAATRILVTGADGFVGAHLCRRLTLRGHRVRAAVRRLAVGPNPPALGTHAFGDLAAAPDWTAALEGVEVVIHLAARAHVTRETAGDPLEVFRCVNVAPSLELLRACQRGGVRRLVFVSSIGVLGTESSERPFTEADEPHPTEPYAISKWEAERELSALATRAATQLVIVRPTLVCGPQARGNFDRLIRLVRRGLPLPLGSVRGRRNFVGVTNLCALLELCATHAAAAHHTFNAADPEVLSTPELLTILAQALGVKARLVPCPPPLLRFAGRMLGRERAVRRLTESLLVDASRARQELGWRSELPLSEELAAMARAAAEPG